MRRPPLVYVLHSGKLFGTERMALATLAAVRAEYEPWVIAPPGGALAAARREGMRALPFQSRFELIRRLHRAMRSAPRVSLCATAVTHSLLAWGLALSSGTALRHVHVVHGGTDEVHSYGRKRLLNRLPVDFVAVSAFVRERLLAHGVPSRRITVIENCLLGPHASVRPARPDHPCAAAAERVAIVSRLDPIKRVDLLLDALDRNPAARSLQYDVYGSGSDGPALEARAARDHPNVHFHGFVEDVPQRLRQADLLLHLCPEEPFGLVLLEAMAVGLPVVAPNAGGVRTIIDHGRTGYLYPPRDAGELGRTLAAWGRAMPSSRERVIDNAFEALRTRFSPPRMARAYRGLLRHRGREVVGTPRGTAAAG